MPALSRKHAAPTDAEFEALRLRYRRSLRTGKSVRWRNIGAGVAVLSVVAILALLRFFPNHPATQPAVALLFGSVALWFLSASVRGLSNKTKGTALADRDPFGLKAQERGQLLDRLRRRADRCVCPVCVGLMTIDASGLGACTECGHEEDRAGWPLTELVAPEGLEAIDDDTHEWVLSERERLGRVLVRAHIVTGIVVLALVVLWIATKSNPIGIGVIVATLATVVVTDALERQRLACDALLATRPDRWDPSATPIALSRLERANGTDSARERLVRAAQRVLSRRDRG